MRFLFIETKNKILNIFIRTIYLINPIIIYTPQ